MAILTAGTKLYYSTDSGTSYTELVEIIDYPDMGSTPTKVDTTTLSNLKIKTSMLGLQEVPDLTFNAFYDKTVFGVIDALRDEYDFKLEFGEDGVDGILTWTGEIRVYVSGAGADEARQMQLTLSATSEIVLA